MASEVEASEPTLIERLINSRNRDLSLLLPLILGVTNATVFSGDDPLGESADLRDRIILINPLTQGMVVIEGSSSSFDSMMRGLLSRDGQPPASKASIESMPFVEIREGVEGECVVCLEEWETGGLVKEMPCKHRFHGDCIEKWLGIHGSCPVCRYKMPVEDDDFTKKNDGGEPGSEDRGRRREIWVSFSFSRQRRNGSTDSDDHSVTPPSPSGPDHEMENYIH